MKMLSVIASLFVVLFISVVFTTVQAQTMLVVDLNKAKLTWQWAQGVGGTVDKFNIKCGTTPTTVTRITTITDPLSRSANVKDVITGSGQWYCVVNAENSFGVSGDSNQVPFAAGEIPLAPTNFAVTAN